MRYSTRDLVYIAIFGSVWGLLEITIGGYLHVIFPPLTDTFFVGLVMGSLGIVVALAGRRFVPKAGAVLMIAVIAMILKGISLGGVKLGPMLAILIQGALMELALKVGGGTTRSAFLLAGALAVSWNFFHRFLMMWLLYGQGVVEVARKMAVDGSALLGLPASSVPAILGVLFFARVIVGLFAGWIAWNLSNAVVRRRAGQPAQGQGG